MIIDFASPCSELRLNFWIEFLRSVPAWIALIISFVLPFITMKVEIEKANKQFIFQEKYKIFTEHFIQLYSFNNRLKNLLATLMFFTSEDYDSLNKNELCAELNKNLKDFYNEWIIIKDKEAKIWLVADFNTLATKTDLIKLVADFSNALNFLNDDGVFAINTETLNNLIELGQKIQTPISDYLKHYREHIDKFN